MATAAAKRYAKAVFERAEEERDIDEWSRRLAQVRAVLSDETVAAILTNPTIPSQRRMEVFGDGAFDTETANLIKLLIEANRVHEIDGIVEEFEQLADDAAGRVRATVTTAVELESADRDRVAAQLSKQLGKEVRMRAEVDPRILGGLKVQYGDRLIDASVASRLQQLRRRLTEAS